VGIISTIFRPAGSEYGVGGTIAAHGCGDMGADRGWVPENGFDSIRNREPGIEKERGYEETHRG
jgi:hypothetical protein